MTSIVRNKNKEKYVHSGYGTAFDGKSEWSCDNGTARNVMIFGVDSSSHSGNRKNNFLILGEGPTFAINRSFGSPKKSLLLFLLKQTQNFV